MIYSTFTKPRTRLRRRSKKKAASDREREKAKDVVFARANGICEVARCRNVGEHYHEKLPRSAGGSPSDPDNMLLACAFHHRKFHVQPEWARAQGYVISRYQLATFDSVQEMRGEL